MYNFLEIERAIGENCTIREVTTRNLFYVYVSMTIYHRTLAELNLRYRYLPVLVRVNAGI